MEKATFDLLGGGLVVWTRSTSTSNWYVVATAFITKRSTRFVIESSVDPSLERSRFMLDSQYKVHNENFFIK